MPSLMNLTMILLGRLPRLHHLPGQDVRVDDEAAEIPEHPGHRALPGPDPPGDRATGTVYSYREYYSL